MLRRKIIPLIEIASGATSLSVGLLGTEGATGGENCGGLGMSVVFIPAAVGATKSPNKSLGPYNASSGGGVDLGTFFLLLVEARDAEERVAGAATCQIERHQEASKEKS